MTQLRKNTGDDADEGKYLISSGTDMGLDFCSGDGVLAKCALCAFKDIHKTIQQ